MLDAMADDIEWDSRYPSIVPFSGVWRGHDGVKRLISTLGETIQILAFEIQEFVAANDKVVVLGFEEATAKSTGRTYRNEWVHVWTVQGGKLAKLRNYNDTAAVAAAFA
jgi:ketosteroid isomerase-like protein